MANQAFRIIPLNGSGGAMTVIRCSIPTGYMEIWEDIGQAPGGGGNPNGGVFQGLLGNYLDPFTGLPVPNNSVDTFPPPSAANPQTAAPISIGDPRHEHGAQKEPIGNGGSGTYTDTRSAAPQTLPGTPGMQAPVLGTPVWQGKSLTATATQVLVKEWA